MALGLIGTLELAKRSLDTNRQGIELTGHNLSNVSNPAYSRQRLRIQTADTLPSPKGPIGTGAVVSALEQIRDRLLDSEITNEMSVTGFLDARKRTLEFAEVNLGQQLDRQSTTPEGATAALGVGGQFGLVEGLTEFFNSLQALTTRPQAIADRQVTLLKAENLTDKFNVVSQRLTNLRADLNTSVQDDVKEVNKLLAEISELSKSISASEVGNFGSANDLRDRRQAKVEALAKLVDLTTSENANTKALNLSIARTSFISANNSVTTLTTFTDANGGIQVKPANQAANTALGLTSGKIKGTIDARDGTGTTFSVSTLATELDTLASTLITRVNAEHRDGYALDGTSGRDFFTGTKASDIKVNSTIRLNPSLIQASREANQPGNNEVALKLARLATESQTALSNLTFIDSYNQTVANLGQALSNTNSQIQDQEAVNRMLLRQRESLGGVSIDEEMANLIIFQRAFEASARMISTLDELLQNVINLGG